jgi:hypothetical protein
MIEFLKLFINYLVIIIDNLKKGIGNGEKVLGQGVLIAL